jgi:hypothetical protein
MKKFLITICVYIGIVGIGMAETMNVTWYNTDGTVYDTTMCTVGGTLILPASPTRRGYTFKGWAFYNQIEYIKSTGTQWIDTGVNPGDNSSFEWQLDFAFASSGNNYNYSGHGVGSWIKFDIKNATTVGIQASGNNQETRLTTNPFNRHLYRMSSSGFCSLDGQEYTLDYDKSVSRGTLYIFSVNKVSSSYSSGYFYSSRIWANNTLVRDFIPVLDYDGVACLYDKVSNTFFYNAGTGDFIAGPAL